MRLKNQDVFSYFADTVMTYQRTDKGQYGTSYKLAFMTDENGVPERTCFEVVGSDQTPVTIQSILPDLAGFQVGISRFTELYNLKIEIKIVAYH